MPRSAEAAALGRPSRPLLRRGAALLGIGIALSLVGAPGARGEREPAPPAATLVLVHFWATWCPPCLDELESIVAFYEGPYRELAARGVSLKVVSNDVRSEDLEAFLAERALPFPVMLDSMGSLRAELQLNGLPATALLGPDGGVRDRILGGVDWASPEFLSRLELHLEHDPEEAPAWRESALRP